MLMPELEDLQIAK